jgi:hypothetical protein
MPVRFDGDEPTRDERGGIPEEAGHAAGHRQPPHGGTDDGDAPFRATRVKNGPPSGSLTDVCKCSTMNM